MLFDLQGRRKRMIQVIYAGLAVLMGAGLVLFGIGGGVSGGFLDSLRGGGGGGGNDALEKRIDKQEQRLAANPNSQIVLKELVRDHYQLATARIPQNTSEFPDSAKPDLNKAAAYWQRYVKLAGDKTDASLANYAAQIYTALQRPKDAQEAYRILAERANDTNSYLQLVVAATTAGDTRTADLAGLKAIDLAPKQARKAVAKQVKQFKKQGQAQQVTPSSGS